MIYITRLLIIGLFCLMATSCISTKYIQQQHYLLDVKTLPEKKEMVYNSTVFIDNITALAPFDQLDFLYRIKSGRYLTDYYNGFMVLPVEQIKPMLMNYLKALGKFNLDITRSLTIPNKLKIQLIELYADYRDNNHPQAVIAMRFTLSRSLQNNTVILLDKILYGRVTLKEKNTVSLISSWNIGLQDVLKRGVAVLNEVLSKAEVLREEI